MESAMLTILAAVALGAGIAPPPPPCAGTSVTVSLDDEGGAFNGMSHSGTRLTVRNTGTVACRFPVRVALVFKDAKEAWLPIIAGEIKPVRPGTIQIQEPGALTSNLTMTLSPGQTVSSTLRWVAADVYGQGQGRCLRPRTIELRLGPGAIDAIDLPFKSTVCGERGKMIMVDRSRWDGTKP
jgi:Protein of unknown function (DUF4232)